MQLHCGFGYDEYAHYDVTLIGLGKLASLNTWVVTSALTIEAPRGRLNRLMAFL